MAINGRFKVNHGDVFPHGAFVVGDVEAVRDFERSTRERPVQATDKESGQLVWSVSVLDPDPEARKDAKTVTVKISAPVQPVPPGELAAGLPFRPVEFDGLTVTPYLNENGGRPRVAYSFRATGMRSPAGAGKPSPRSGSEAA
ncbi:hypothetical protein GCM10017691_02110 [Pseudonocardia petroleophila]|uniref:Plasmid replication, integration and excision activator n=1 Tax=Pseudonocardia petroleophila TaxID=37331 RepID=A0A7G7ML47_9PSEU|nr:plasmid replication, integration and excision activator [Pseudonocardia petroleophila]QNG53508.1 plasmid replication, integration and excision activator [Pseudonocardia petroleophila]